MATTAGVFSNQMTAGHVLTRSAAAPMAGSTSSTNSTASSSGSSDSSATISANDFLTLLVTEMQNQDPTADTDPNEYINQLVNVNSLEQLIDINQTLSTDVGSTSSSTTGAKPGVTAAASSTNQAASPTTSAQSAGSAFSGVSGAPASSASTTSTQRIPGNLSVPGANPAAQRVGHALAGRTHAASLEGTSSATQ